MENKLDKLFRDKLEHHSVQPSAQAWEKVAAGFPKKNNTVVWAWRLAAAIALICVLSLLIISPWKGEEASTLAKEEAKKETESTTVEQNKTEVQEIKQEKPKVIEPKTTKKVTAPKLMNRPIDQPVAEIKQEAIDSKIEAVAGNSIETTKIETTIAAIPNETNTATEKTLVIVYSLAPVEKKPIEEPIKTKPLQRVLTFAKDVKGGETTLASVRDWKDSFFGSEETARVEKQTRNN